MCKLKSFENFELTYARLAKTLSFDVRNSEKLANRHVMSFLTNNQLQKQILCNQWVVCYKWHRKLYDERHTPTYPHSKV